MAGGVLLLVLGVHPLLIVPAGGCALLVELLAPEPTIELLAEVFEDAPLGYDPDPELSLQSSGAEG